MEGLLSGEQLKKYDSRRVHVGGLGDWGTVDLLGGEIRNRADDLICRVRDVRDRADQAEVCKLDAVITVDQDVVGFDIAVHHAFLMGDCESREHRPHHLGSGVWWHRATLGEQFAQRSAGDQLHDQEHLVCGLALGSEVVHVDQVGV